jgi:epoxyqueuosine reductase QueG
MDSPRQWIVVQRDILYSIVTDAVLVSDTVLDPRYAIDNVCNKCQACKAACPPSMFKTDEEDLNF